MRYSRRRFQKLVSFLALAPLVVRAAVEADAVPLVVVKGDKATVFGQILGFDALLAVLKERDIKAAKLQFIDSDDGHFEFIGKVIYGLHRAGIECKVVDAEQRGDA